MLTCAFFVSQHFVIFDFIHLTKVILALMDIVLEHDDPSVRKKGTILLNLCSELNLIKELVTDIVAESG